MFLVVGIVVAALAVGICLFVRRRRRRTTPRFLRHSISRPIPVPDDDPFDDPGSFNTGPEMRYATGYRDHAVANEAANGAGYARSPFDDEMEPASATGSGSYHSGDRLNGLGLAGISAGSNVGRRFSAGGRSSTESRARQLTNNSSIGVAITSDQLVDARTPRKTGSSSARSSPSLYPPSLPALRGEGSGSLVDIPLSTNDSAARLPSPSSNSSTTRLPSSPTSRKPVPELPEPLVPTPLAPRPLTAQQRQVEQQQAKPPVLPPRSPLRRNSSTRPISRSQPPIPLASIQTQLSEKALEEPRLQTYVPLTPPASFSSISPTGSHLGHGEPPSPAASGSGSANPFSDAHEQQLVHTGPPGLFPPEPVTPPPPALKTKTSRRENFYTRSIGQQVRLSGHDGRRVHMTDSCPHRNLRLSSGGTEAFGRWTE